MSEPKVTRYITFEEYLRLEGKSEVRHEYVHGVLFAMSGATEAHSNISANLNGALFNFFRGKGCRVYQGHMMVFVSAMNSAYYPDIMVTCEPFDANSQYKTGPSIMVEVLSPSTQHIDRREKLIAYQQLESLQFYLLVHQKRMRVELHRRISETEWETVILHGSDVLRLDLIPGKSFVMPVKEIYENLNFPSFVEEEEEEYELV